MKRAVIGLIAAVALATVTGGAFYAGTKVGENRVLQNPAGFFQQRAGGQGGQFLSPFGTPGTPQPGQRGALGGGITGTIERVEGSTLVIDTGQELIRVQTTDTTLIEKYMSASVGDLEVGERVIVSGSRNNDGSITARSIQSLRAFPAVTPSQ